MDTRVWPRALPILAFLSVAGCGGSTPGQSYTSDVTFFVSNNTQTLSPQAAFDRLTGPEQASLETAAAAVLQGNAVLECRSEPVLGAYTYTRDGSETADNTETYETAPQQLLPTSTVFTIAAQLCGALGQESVAVMIPASQGQVCDLKVTFASPTQTIAAVIASLQAALPAAFTQAYSIHLNVPYGTYPLETVAAVEWLGSQLDQDILRKAFPNDTVTVLTGSALLVHKDGTTEPL